MLHKAWNSKGEIPYCFPRSSIKFQGHTVQNITDFDPNWAFPVYGPVAAFKSLRFALFVCICLVQIYMDWVPGFLHTCFMFTKFVQLCLHLWQATGLDAWASRVKCPARFVSHLHEICIYIWVVYSLCFFCCLFITVTWWYVWCIEWASGNQEEVQACLVTLWLFIISCYSLYKTTLGVCYAHDLKIIHIFINTRWIFMFNVSI